MPRLGLLPLLSWPGPLPREPSADDSSRIGGYPIGGGSSPEGEAVRSSPNRRPRYAPLEAGNPAFSRGTLRSRGERNSVAGRAHAEPPGEGLEPPSGGLRNPVLS